MRTIRALMFLFGIALAGGVRGEPIELRFGHIGGPGSLFEATAQEFARRVNERLGNQARVSVYGSSALGDDTKMLEKVRAGVITFSLPTAVMESVDDVFGLFEMPFLIRDRAHMQRVRDAIFTNTLQPAAKAKGLRLLAIWELGFRHITNNTRPITFPEDLQGLRLRVPKGLWRARMFEAYGATPVLVSFDQIVTELKKGTIEGQENPLSQLYPAGIHEHQKYLTLSFHLYSPAFLVAGEEHFSMLPHDIQGTLSEVASDLEDWSRKEGERLEIETIARLRGKMEINQLDLIEFFHTAAIGIYRDYAASVPGGGELIARVEALAKAAK
jgi:TRAP-type transport system periplasmic protein